MGVPYGLVEDVELLPEDYAKCSYNRGCMQSGIEMFPSINLPPWWAIGGNYWVCGNYSWVFCGALYYETRSPYDCKAAIEAKNLM